MNVASLLAAIDTLGEKVAAQEAEIAQLREALAAAVKGADDDVRAD